MKTFLPPFLLFLPYFLWAQAIDSATIWQVDSLIQISRTLTSQQEFDKALEVNAAAEKLAGEKLGRESAAYGSCCFNRGVVLWKKGDYPEAEQWYLESIAIRKKTVGKDHPDYALSLNNLATLYMYMGQYEKAEPLYLESIAIREKALGKDHPDYAISLNNLATLYRYIGHYEKAEPVYLESIAIREKVLGKDHPDYAWSLNALGLLYWDMGQYEKAEPLYLEAIAIREKILGKDHPDYAWSLNNLGLLYWNMGQYENAEPLYLESKAILEKALGEEHPDYAFILNNLGLLYWDMGQYEKAEPLYLESKAIREKALGKDHPDYAQSLNNLGLLYWNMGQYEKTELLYLEAKAIREKALGKNHPDYALSLNNLGLLYWNMGQYEKAELLYLESKAIRENALGKNHPDYAQSLNNLATLYDRIGQYEKAELLYLESKAIRENALGKDHPDYALSMNRLGGLYQSMGQYEKAEPFFIELAASHQSLAAQALHHLSERELNIVLNMYSEAQHRTLSFTQLFSGEMLTSACYDNSIFYKGFLLNATNQVKRLALSDSTSTEKFNRLKGYQRRLATQYALPVSERESSIVAALETQVNDLEKELTRTVAGYGEAMRQVKWQEVQASLQSGEAAIEFVHYCYYDKKATDSTMYVALLLLPGMEQPKFVPLFEEKQLTEVLAPGKNAQSSELFAQIYSRGVKPVRTTQFKELYELTWQPLDSLLKGAKTVYYSPSGLLHRINFDAVPIDKKENLSDRFRLVRLGSTRSLVVPDLTKISGANDAALYGGIQYELDTTSVAKDSTGQNPFAGYSTELSFRYADRSVPERGNNWDYLQGTEKEVSSINTLLQKSKFKVQVFSGEAATEESFKSIGRGKSSPRILHIATHGFFFPDPKSVGSQQSALSGEEPVFKISDHPMIRSGLIFAGGNYAWQTGKPLQPDMEDGILTAYEISQMNLSNTELVVLSACETGLGDIQGNEGVYGLQRAFKIAGAKYLVMSLWQVPDQETSIFMETFYRHWIEDNLSIPDAFRTTQREMRERFIHPYQWAGFVLVE